MNNETIFEENQTQMTLFDDGGNTLFEEESFESMDVFEPFEVLEAQHPYLEVGTIFVRKYIIKKFLGQGALGIAYVAEEEGSYNRVVIKEFFPKGMVKRESDSTVVLEENATVHQQKSYTKMKKVFEEEAQNIVTINTVPHKNVAGFVSLERDVNNTVYYLMPYSKGEELGDYLKRLKSEGHELTQKEIMALIEPLLHGLSHIHSYGVYHKDIKPANIYLREDDEPILIDFGASVTSAHLMTPSYAPIEQIKRLSSEIGAYTDLYSLGVMMYEMVMGRKPIQSKLRAEIIGRGEQDPYQSLAKNKALKNRFEKHFLEAIDHVLALAYRARPQSAKEFNEELRGDLQRKKRNRLIGFMLLGIMVFGALGYAVYEKKRKKFAYLIVPNSEKSQLLVDNKIISPQKDGRYKILAGKHTLEIKNGFSYLSKVTELSLNKEGGQQRVENPLIKKQVPFEVRTKNDLLAEVLVNGEFVGKTPYVGKLYYETLDKKYTVEVKKEGYDDADKKIVYYKSLMNKEKNSITVALRKQEGFVEIKSPVGFKVKVNGRLVKDKNGRIELTPLSFKRVPGVYVVLLYSSKREKGVRVYEHISRSVTVKDKEKTLFPQIKAVKSKKYLLLKKREEKKILSKSSHLSKRREILTKVRIPEMGRAVNGVYFSKREVTYDELVRFLNSVRLSAEVLKKYFMLHSNSVAKYIKREFENGVAHYFVYKGYENYPVIHVSWAGANAYIEWLNSQSKFYYRLPSQNEWESVAEFGLAGVVEGTLSPVGTKRANTLGLYDVFGNVAEWGEDDEGEFSKVVFGGSYQTLHGYMSATMRNSMNKYSSKNSDIGFRLVR